MDQESSPATGHMAIGLTSQDSGCAVIKTRTFLDATQRDLLSALKDWPLWTMLGWNDIRQRYRRSTLGPFWITLSMATFIGVLGVIYSRIFHVDVEIYLPF